MKIVNYIYYLILFCFASFFPLKTFSQSKKKQIDTLSSKLEKAIQNTILLSRVNDSLVNYLKEEAKINELSLTNLKSEIAKMKSKLDSSQLDLIKNKIIFDSINNEFLTLKANELTNIKKLQALQDSIKKTDESNLLLERIKLINNFLKGKTYRLLFYESYDGVGPDGGSFTSIALINGTYYLGDISNGGVQIIKKHPNQNHLSINTNIKIDENLRFTLSRGEDLREGYISRSYALWGDNPSLFPDSITSKILLKNTSSTILPITILELGTIRGSWDFVFYLNIGITKYFFGGKTYEIENPIILKSNHVEYIFSLIK